MRHRRKRLARQRRKTVDDARRYEEIVGLIRSMESRSMSVRDVQLKYYKGALSVYLGMRCASDAGPP